MCISIQALQVVLTHHQVVERVHRAWSEEWSAGRGCWGDARFILIVFHSFLPAPYPFLPAPYPSLPAPYPFLPALYPSLSCFLGKQRLLPRRAFCLYPSGQILLAWDSLSHCRVLARVLTACQEGQEAGGQAKTGDTAAAAQGSISSPSSGPLGQRKPRQEGQGCHQPERHRKLPHPPSHPAPRA